MKTFFLRFNENGFEFSFVQDENARAVVFFLHHARMQRLQFEINGHAIP